MNMENLSPKWSSADLVKVLLPSLQQVASLMGASVFLAVGSGCEGKFIYSSGYLKDVFEHGDMKPSSSDVDLAAGTDEAERKENGHQGSVVSNLRRICEDDPSPGRQRCRRRREEESPRESREGRESRNSRRKSIEESGRMRSRSRHRSPARKPLDGPSETESRSRHRSPLRPSSDIHDSSTRQYRTIAFSTTDKESTAKRKDDAKELYTRYKYSYIETNERQGVVNVEFPSKEDALRAFIATPKMLKSMKNRKNKYLNVSFHVAPELSPSCDYENAPGLSLLVWTDDSVEKVDLREQMSVFGPVFSVKKCPCLSWCFVVTFSRISDAKQAMESFNPRFPSGKCIALSFYKVKSNFVWIGGVENSLTKEDLETMGRKHGKINGTYLNEVTNQACVDFSMLHTELLDAIHSSGFLMLDGKVFDVDYVDEDFVNHFRDTLVDNPVVESMENHADCGLMNLTNFNVSIPI